MTTIPRGLRRLTRDVDNPVHDKRTRYGHKSVATYKAGSVFTYTPGEMRRTRTGTEYPEAPTARTLTGYIHSTELVEALVEASVPHTPTTWAEVVLERNFDNPEFFALDAMERMLADGSLTVDRARQIVTDILDAPPKE